jgi:DNA repair protein RecO (recombination protein O)
MATSNAGDSDLAFVLHTYPYRETSLILEVFSRRCGRMGIIARGARRPRSALRGTLLPFQPLALAWFGKAELKTLKTAEAERIYPQLAGPSLLSAFYLNELILKLSHREDPHEGLFDAYDAALLALQVITREAVNQAGDAVARREPMKQIAATLRRFEKQLLREMGYGLLLEQEAESGAPIVAAQHYRYVLEKGPVAASPGAIATYDAVQLSGKTLLDLARDDYDDPVTAQQSKQLMRFVINHFLNGAELHTRQIIKELQQN